MLNFIKNIFRKKDPLSIYRPKERMIFQFWNGQKMVSGDPLVLFKRMSDVGPELAIDIKVSSSPSKDASKAHNNVVDKIRGIFGVQSLEQGGLSELETLQLLDTFLLYCDRVKKNSSQSVIWPTPSVDSTSSSEENPPTLNSSDSGSIESESKTDEPEQWQSELE